MKNRLMLPNGLYQCFAQSLKVQSATHKKKGGFLKKQSRLFAAEFLKKGKLFHSTLQMGNTSFPKFKMHQDEGSSSASCLLSSCSIGTSIFKFLTLGCSDISTEHLIFNLENV